MIIPQTLSVNITALLWINLPFLSIAQNRQPAPPTLKKALVTHLSLERNHQDDQSKKRAIKVYGNPLFTSPIPGQNATSLHLNGKNQWLEIPGGKPWSPGTDDFSISLWMHTNDSINDVLGDLVSQYDRPGRKGFRLGFLDNAVAMSHANSRQLSFGIDDNKASEWIDCGRPGNALIAFTMADFKGKLYVGTCEPGAKEAGRVYRYDENRQWVDCGNPDGSNAVMGMAVYEGELYVGTGKYRVAGSSLSESENTTLGGRVFRYAGDHRWVDCGQLPGTEATGGMVVFQKELYASSLYHPGLFRYDKGKNTWISCGAPQDNGSKRVVSLAVYNDYLYATCYDTGKVYRYDGAAWTDCGLVGDNTQTYSFTVYEGSLYVATWPTGRVYRFDGIGKWTDVGRLGNELEVMGMLVHNGRFLGGTLPLAEVYSFEGDTTWKKLDQLDKTPDVKYRRAWTMAEHNGKVYCTTLPSGHIYSWEAGKSATVTEPISPGWHHVTAVKADSRLKLYLDGKLAAESGTFEPEEYDLESKAPLKIGFGTNDYFSGNIRAFRLYERSLKPEEIEYLARDPGYSP